MIHRDIGMNTNELIHNRTDNQTRMRSNNDHYLQNYYPVSINMSPYICNYSPVILNANTGYTMVNNPSESASDQSGLLSPNPENIDRPLYRISTWQDIADLYEGDEQRPKCGKLSNNVYFTQRATSSDVYMLFDRKCDYINNFVNYYFSDKNLARDRKLVDLMDDKGVIPLSALIKFPKLHQIDSTIEDLIKAFQTNTVVMLSETNGEKGALRRDRWFPLYGHKVAPSDEVSESSSVSEQPQIASPQSENVQPQNQPVFYYPQIYAQQSANIGGLAYYSPSAFLPVNTQFQAHHANQMNSQAMLWPISHHDFGNQNILQHMPMTRFHATNAESSGNRLNQ